MLNKINLINSFRLCTTYAHQCTYDALKINSAFDCEKNKNILYLLKKKKHFFVILNVRTLILNLSNGLFIFFSLYCTILTYFTGILKVPRVH